MSVEELSRDLEKAAKSLSKMHGREVLFAEDATDGRARLVFEAMQPEGGSIRDTCSEIMAQPEGARHLVRAFNNLKIIRHAGSMNFARAIIESLESGADFEQRIQKMIQLLDHIDPEYSGNLDWIDEKVSEMLDDLHDSGQKVQLWLHWCASTVRVCSTAHSLISVVGAHRPKSIEKFVLRDLRQRLEDETGTPWDLRAAALYLLLGNGVVTLGFAQDFVDRAYVSFPLESLAGVEILSLAVENDGVQIAEFSQVQTRLAQIRRENLFLLDMPQESFVQASLRVIEGFGAMPGTAVELSHLLQSRDKNERMILSAFLDDARCAEWFRLARRFGVLRDLALQFFGHFNPENPIQREFSVKLVTVLLENENADALLTDEWLVACDSDDADVLRTLLPTWISFCGG